MSIESRVLKNYTGVLNGISVTGLPHLRNIGLIQKRITIRPMYQAFLFNKGFFLR